MHCPNKSQILITFFKRQFFYRPLNLANRTMHTVILCHQPISCHGFSAATKDTLKG